MKSSLRTALMSATAAVVFASSVWVLGAQEQGAAAPGRGQGGGRGRGRQAGPALPTPRLADGTVNFGRVPGEKGVWNTPYITNMANQLVGDDGQPLPEIVQAYSVSPEYARGVSEGIDHFCSRTAVLE